MAESDTWGLGIYDARQNQDCSNMELLVLEALGEG